MMTVVHFIKFIIKLLLFIVLLPFFLLWIYLRYRIFRFALITAMKEANMPKDYAKELAREMSIRKFLFQKSKAGDKHGFYNFRI